MRPSQRTEAAAPGATQVGNQIRRQPRVTSSHAHPGSAARTSTGAGCSVDAVPAASISQRSPQASSTKSLPNERASARNAQMDDASQEFENGSQQRPAKRRAPFRQAPPCSTQDASYTGRFQLFRSLTKPHVGKLGLTHISHVQLRRRWNPGLQSKTRPDVGGSPLIRFSMLASEGHFSSNYWHVSLRRVMSGFRNLLFLPRVELP